MKKTILNPSIWILTACLFTSGALAQLPLDTLNNWVKQNLKSSNYAEEVYHKAQEALALAKTQENSNAINIARRNLSIYHENSGDLDSSIYYLELNRDFYIEAKDTNALAETYLEIKLVLGIKAEYAKAAEQVFAALALYEKTGNKKGIANCYVDLCDLLYYEDKYKKSVEYCDKAIAIQKEINAQEDLAKSLRFKASSQLFSGDDLEDALATINQAIELYEGMDGKEIELMASKNGRGNILKYLGRYDEAIADYRSNYEKCLEIGFKPYVIPSIGNIGHVYKLQGKFEEALPYTLEAIDLIMETGDTKNLWENYMHAADIYEELGNFEKANEYNKLYASAYSDYLQSIVERLESEAQIKYETAKKDELIALQEKELEQQKQIQILYFSIAIILLISLAGMLQSRYRLRRKQKEVERSKEELEVSIENLKTTQQQLIHAEKMASLGELTAGIAHEIQNPLNFITNFSEVNEELIQEMKEEIKNGNLEEVEAIADDLSENEGKISHHGKRADGIVKGMLQHSRTSAGGKEPTDLNALADEYLRLSYHGLRAKDKKFNANFKTDFDPDLPRIDVVPQDIGRVLLNLINNAFHACNERSRSVVSSIASETEGSGYKPEVIVKTALSPLEGGLRGVIIRVKDNGTGIPEEIKDKIFQPFFTTKPTGEGTGLGLSLSYDIITKGHGGELHLETQTGKGSEFIIKIPYTT